MTGLLRPFFRKRPTRAQVKTGQSFFEIKRVFREQSPEFGSQPRRPHERPVPETAAVLQGAARSPLGGEGCQDSEDEVTPRSGPL